MPKLLINVKEKILNTTQALLLEKGYSSLNIREIASKCGIGLGTIYNYYHSKDDIIRDIVQNDWIKMLQRIDTTNKSEGNTKEKLKEIFESLKSFVGKYHDTWVSMYMSSTEKADFNNIHAERSSYKEQIRAKIYVALSEVTFAHEDEKAFICGFVANNFILYSMEKTLHYEKLEKVLMRVIE